ncbi:hypothetical protein A2U01_0103691, partial [Trifolium medium]|nr:hypothetical protein [Trifolium medium]
MAEGGINLIPIRRLWDPLVDEWMVGEDGVDLIGSGFELI